jgi:hypothetical protein
MSLGFYMPKTGRGANMLIFMLISNFSGLKYVIFKLKNVIFKVENIIFKFENVIFKFENVIFNIENVIFKLENVFFKLKNIIFKLEKVIFKLIHDIFKTEKTILSKLSYMSNWNNSGQEWNFSRLLFGHIKSHEIQELLDEP